MSSIHNYAYAELIDKGQVQAALRVVRAAVTYEPELKIRIFEDTVSAIEYETKDKLEESIQSVLQKDLDGYIFRSNGSMDGTIAPAIMGVFKEFYQKENSPVAFLGYSGLPDLNLRELLLREVVTDASIEIADNLILLQDIKQELDSSVSPPPRERLNYFRAILMLKHEIRTGFKDAEPLLLAE